MMIENAVDLEIERDGLIADLNEARREAFNRGQESARLTEIAAYLDAKLFALADAWRADIRAHMDGCAATFSNNVPDDCGCGLTEKRDREIAMIKDEMTEAKSDTASLSMSEQLIAMSKENDALWDENLRLRKRVQVNE